MIKNIQIKSGQFLKGEVIIPPSKSLSHRAIIAASFASGTSEISNLIQSMDIKVTTKCMEQLGAEVTIDDKNFVIQGISNEPKLYESVFKCHESGSTLRFMIPIAMLTNKAVSFEGQGKLMTRPLDSYFELFKQQNIPYVYHNSLPLSIEGSLKPDVFKLRGDISSQFITGLLFALPLLNGDSEILITTKLESKGYVDLTLDVLNQFGIHIENDHYKRFIVKGNQAYKAQNYRVEGDYSQVAFWIVAGLMNGELDCTDMKKNTKQGDQEILDIVSRMGAKIIFKNDTISVQKTTTIPTIIDGSQCPDIIPVLAVLAAVTPGETRIINAERLRIKECDRLTAISTELNKLGGDVTELKDGLIIQGKSHLKGGQVKGWNDHRIVMALTVASLLCEEDVFIEGCDAITKSYPHFFEQFKNLGGSFNEWHLES